MRKTALANLLIWAVLGVKSLPAAGDPANSPAGPRVLEMRGLWYDYFGVDRAIARAGGAIATQTWAGDRGLAYYSPASPADLARYRLLIVANIPGNNLAGPLAPAALRQYVDGGGSVLILGGLYGFGPDYHGNPIETISPVTFGAAKDLESGWFPIAATPEAAAYSLAEKPSVLWMHDVTAKPGAHVLLTAGGKPLLIEGDFGKGRVAVFAGTVLGDPATGQMPFWQWDEWPRVLGDTVTWLMAPHAETGSDAPAVPAAPAAGAQPLTDQTLLLQSADLCRDGQTATTILNTLAHGQSKLSPADVDQIDARLSPYIDASAADATSGLMQSDDLGHISLGLRLLGQVRAPGALNLLTNALKAGDLAAAAGDATAPGGDGLTTDPMPAVADKNREGAIRLNALIGLGRLGDPSALPAIQEAETAAQKGLTPAGTFPAIPAAADLISRAAAIAALRCGDSGSADAALNAELAARDTLVANMITVSDKPYSAAFAAKSDADVALIGLPDSVLPAFAKSVAESDDPWAVPVAYTVFGKAFRPSLSAQVSQILKNAKLPAVADLSARP